MLYNTIWMWSLVIRTDCFCNSSVFCPILMVLSCVAQGVRHHRHVFCLWTVYKQLPISSARKWRHSRKLQKRDGSCWMSSNDWESESLHYTQHRKWPEADSWGINDGWKETTYSELERCWDAGSSSYTFWDVCVVMMMMITGWILIGQVMI